MTGTRVLGWRAELTATGDVKQIQRMFNEY
jgi:hypothetical protein